MRTFLLVACLATLCSSASAQGVWDRFKELKTTDPELYEAIYILLASSMKGNDVSGGFDYSIGEADLQCQEAFDGGFDNCTVEIEVEAESHADNLDNRSADLEFGCDVEIVTYDSDGFSSYDSETETVDLSFYGSGRDYETVEVDFNFYSFEPVVRVQVSSVECSLRSIN